MIKHISECNKQGDAWVQAVIDIIHAYAEAKMVALHEFIATCEKFKHVENEQPQEIIEFISSLLEPNIDARIFEIVSNANDGGIDFVIKSTEAPAKLLQKIKEGAEKQYSVDAVVEKYLNCIEEIINIENLKDALKITVAQGNIQTVLHEIIKQSKVEFYFNESWYKTW